MHIADGAMRICWGLFSLVEVAMIDCFNDTEDVANEKEDLALITFFGDAFVLID